MSSTQVRAGVAELLSLAVGRTVAEGETVLRASEPGWDSLKHIELILMLEERFGVQFSEEEIAALRSSAEIVSSIEAKGAA